MGDLLNRSWKIRHRLVELIPSGYGLKDAQQDTAAPAGNPE
jgi:hypothetical protein